MEWPGPEAPRRAGQPDEAAGPSPSQYEEKDKAFKEQLSHLATLLPTLQVHLVICSSFLSSASKAEFLDLGYVSPPNSCGVSQLSPLGLAACHLEAGPGASGFTFFPSFTPSSLSHLGAPESLLKGQGNLEGSISLRSPKVWSVYWSPASPTFTVDFGEGCVCGGFPASPGERRKPPTDTR